MKNKTFTMPLIIGAAATALFSTGAGILNVYCGGICLLLGASLLAVFAVYTKKRLRELSALNDTLAAVCAGTYTMALAENTEGELSILRNNLYKVIRLLQSSNEQLAAEKTQLADALADISHQLKTPLTSMMVITDLIRQEGGDGQNGDFAQIMETQCERMSWLISTLLKLSRLDAGTVQMYPAALTASRLTEESLRPFLLTLELRAITVKQEISDFTMQGDLNWLTEALGNIIKNCMEHMEDGGTLTIAAKETTVHYQLEIADDGCGIAEEDLPHIFERFYHGKNASSESVGIGLALTKAILHRHNADVSAQSAPGEGTTFRIKFYKSVI